MSLDNVDFSWFTAGSYLNGENGKCVRYAVATPFAVTEAAPLPLAS